MSSYHSATSLPSGDYLVTVAPTVAATQGDETKTRIPSVELGVRRGVSDRVDVGLKLFGIGAAVDATIQMSRSEDLDIAVAPGLVVNWFPDLAALDPGTDTEEIGQVFPSHLDTHINLPLLLGIRLGQRSQLVIGPRVMVGAIRMPDSTEPSIIPGFVLGVDIPVASWLRVHPEISVHAPLTDYPVPYMTKDTLLIQGGMALEFD